ncbi:unnamed protein product [Hydatigera taeniaeformis]|uniref:GP-PDE domain-containing protein n=1 Tax=Hydatigena taeniaeformis TaxID=6205 RepID=A0A0R3WZW7_HYDTA|nr:unnamed protein product [Hydatigera taeniaeformis]
MKSVCSLGPHNMQCGTFFHMFCLPVYYLAISPALPSEDDEGSGFKNNSARGFTLRPVDPDAGLDETSLLCVGHRGMGAERVETPAEEQWPENTLLSFNKAAELNIPMVELDVQPLRESNDLVVYHSFNIATRRCNRDQSCGCPDYEIDVFSGELFFCISACSSSCLVFERLVNCTQPFILRTQGNGRAIVLSTFNADLCLALRLKQITFPVLFISRAGCEQLFSTYVKSLPPPHSSTRLPPPPHLLDPRHRNALAVIEWAHLIGMDGVVIPGKPLMEATAKSADLARRMAALHLACIPFGSCVSTPDFKRRAAELGLTGICIDNVYQNAW